METGIIALTQVINDFEGLIRELDWAVKVTAIAISLILSFCGFFLMQEPLAPEEEIQDHLGGFCD